MQWEYSKWDDAFKWFKQVNDLMSIFNWLLLQANGNIPEVMKWMNYLQKRGFIDQQINLNKFLDKLEEENIIQKVEMEYKLTSLGERNIRQDALNQIFGSLRKTGFGQHSIPKYGEGGENLTETRPYQFGDPITNIDPMGSLQNALRNSDIDNIQLTENDFEVYEQEHLTTCATVLMIDISHSMVLYGEDRITPAKQVALALTELITTRYPKDKLHVIIFGDDAVEIPLPQIPYIGAGPYHTNTKAGLQLAQVILRRQKFVNKQIFMITDGKPSAIYEDGKLFKNPYGLDPKIVNRTLDEAAACRRNKITVTTFMVTQDPYLVDFVDQFTRINKGRAYYSSPQLLGQYIFVDYIKNRRRTMY
jgi:Ca-activated chloride channel homolog